MILNAHKLAAYLRRLATRQAKHIMYIEGLRAAAEMKGDDGLAKKMKRAADEAQGVERALRGLADRVKEPGKGRDAL